MCGWIGIVLTGNDGVRRLDNQNSSPTRCDDVATLAIQTDQPRLRTSAACTARSMCRQVRVEYRSGRADGARPASGREAARPGLSCIIFPMLYRLQFVAFLACLTLDPARAPAEPRRATPTATDRDPNRSAHTLRAARPGASRLTCAGVRVSSAARADAWPAASDRDDAPPAAAARGGRGVLLHVVMRRHMGRRSPSQRLAACARALAARVSGPARLRYLWDEGKGGRKKARAARGGRPARGACH